LAFTFRGFGAMHYGQCDFRSDGSYVTTLWFVCAYLPVLPIHSKRTRATGKVKYYSMHPKMTYAVLEKTKPHLKQVASVYGWFGLELVIFITATFQHSWWIALPGVLLVGLPFLLRKRAIDRVKAASLRREMGFSPEISEYK